MSTGPFSETFYAGDGGDIHRIRIQPETALLEINGVANTAPAGPATSDARAQVSKNKRKKGLTPRKVGFRVLTPGSTNLTVGTVMYVPWLNGQTYDDVSASGLNGTYVGGATVRTVGGSEESFKK